MILVPSRDLLLPWIDFDPLAWFTSGKAQRNPSTGKIKRNPTTGKVRTKSSTNGYCCCCPACAHCSPAICLPDTLTVQLSGMGYCHCVDSCDGTQARTYSATDPNGTYTLTHKTAEGCGWISDRIPFYVTFAGSRSSSSSTCGSPDTAPVTIGPAYFLVSVFKPNSTTWHFRVNQDPLDPTLTVAPNFDATLTVASGNCDIPTGSASNRFTIGACCYSVAPCSAISLWNSCQVLLDGGPDAGGSLDSGIYGDGTMVIL